MFLFSAQGGPGPRKGRGGVHSPRDQKRSAQAQTCAGVAVMQCPSGVCTDLLPYRYLTARSSNLSSQACLRVLLGNG